MLGSAGGGEGRGMGCVGGSMEKCVGVWEAIR